MPTMTPTANELRNDDARDRRVAAATFQHEVPLPDHIANGDEAAYANRIANFSKGLPHNDLGEVDPAAYDKLLLAVSSQKAADFENIPMGEPDLAKRRKLVNPQAGIAYDFAGADCAHLAMPPAPAFNSAEQAGELIENYWMALTRDVPFTDYATNELTLAAAKEISGLSDFRGPKDAATNEVTPATLFRGLTAGDLAGPYISQLMLRAAMFGADIIDQKIVTTMPGSDHMRSYPTWLAVQRGTKQPKETYDPVRRYIRNGRDLSQFVHIDVLFQGYFDACLLLGTPVAEGGIGAPLNPGNPYAKSKNQEGFATFGAPHIKGILGEIAVRALKAVWYQKWFVHRRMRPEVFAARVHNLRLHPSLGYDIHADATGGDALDRLRSKNHTSLLPMAFFEGSPLHPSYGSGHATVGGACVTILKWFFDENAPVANPLVPGTRDDGQSLVPYDGIDADELTVGGECNKLASNIGIGRNISGVHWRSDYQASLKLGEDVAIATLQDFRTSLNEDFGGCTFTKFDGVTKVTI
ncbi:MAG: vanadium-dependent haloperoxidase [Vulcanimicrobiaceae bacterium]